MGNTVSQRPSATARRCGADLSHKRGNETIGRTPWLRPAPNTPTATPRRVQLDPPTSAIAPPRRNLARRPVTALRRPIRRRLPQSDQQNGGSRLRPLLIERNATAPFRPGSRSDSMYSPSASANAASTGRVSCVDASDPPGQSRRSSVRTIASSARGGPAFFRRRASAPRSKGSCYARKPCTQRSACYSFVANDSLEGGSPRHPQLRAVTTSASIAPARPARGPVLPRPYTGTHQTGRPR
jgi:hypothetical protein